MITDRRSVLRWLGIGAAAAPVAGAAIVTAVKEGQASGITPAIPKRRSLRDPYHIPADMIPKGVRYNWKRVFITADQPDFENLNAMIKQGWTPVPRVRHAKLFYTGTASSDVNVLYPPAWIDIGGLVLMEKAIGA